MSVNKIILIRNVEKGPDIRVLDGGNKVVNFPLVTSERGYKLANGTEVLERTEWHNLVLWKGLAEVIEKYVKKGVKRYITEIHVDNLELWGGNHQSNILHNKYHPMDCLSKNINIIIERLITLKSIKYHQCLTISWLCIE